MYEELKPCPFCGGEASYEDMTGELKAWGGCGKWDCLGHDVIWDYEDIKLWNTRAEATETQIEAAVKY